MREKRGITLISVIVIMLAIITAILVTVEVIAIINDINKEENKANVGKKESINNIESEEENETIQDDNIEGINKWVGKYENENTTINIWREDIDQLFVDISRFSEEDFSINSSSFNVTVDTDTNEITHDGEMYDGSSNSVIITYSEDGINVEASSTDEEDLLNSVNGFYSKNEFERSGWDGAYTNGETTIILSEIYEEELNITILQEYSSFSRSIDEYTNQTIEYDEFGEEIFIEKTENGITVQASSTEKEDLLNIISGEYVRQD